MVFQGGGQDRWVTGLGEEGDCQRSPLLDPIFYAQYKASQICGGKIASGDFKSPIAGTGLSLYSQDTAVTILAPLFF